MTVRGHTNRPPHNPILVCGQLRPHLTWEPGNNDCATTGSGTTVSLTDAYNGSGGGSTVSETFDQNASIRSGRQVYLVGCIPALGSWNTANVVAMGGTAPNWTKTVTLPADTSFESRGPAARRTGERPGAESGRAARLSVIPPVIW
ncbi:carbohydrate-binding module family 20 domain-containing protein [Streptomyces sp. NPDC052107]|uniref:carbohydrate-binding module family 20 domain-containing protein n=1 Tax=Streptomyces sp. NPDC052107 TaxID=3155632 RepID=UPI0034381789